MKPARAEPHLGNIHRLTRIRPYDEEPKRARPNWSFAACKEPGRRPHSSIPALKTTIAGISGDSLPSALPTVLSDLKQIPEVVICVDEFGPLNLQPHPGRQWASRGGGGARPRRRRRATYTRPHGVRHLLAAYDLSRDRLYGHIKPRKRRGEFLVFLRYLRTLYPPGIRMGIVLDNFSPHLSTRDDPRVAEWAAANNVELAYTPTNASWLSRIETQFQALRYFTLDGTDHASHHQQASMIRRYIAWRTRNAHDRRFREIVNRAKVA